MKHDVAKGRQIAAEALLINELSKSKGSSFLQGLHTGILIAHYHPEVVGIINETMQTTPEDQRSMPADLLEYVIRRANRIALADDDKSVTARVVDLVS